MYMVEVNDYTLLLHDWMVLEASVPNELVCF